MDFLLSELLGGVYAAWLRKAMEKVCAEVGATRRLKKSCA
jgi:hypothetical protein